MTNLRFPEHETQSDLPPLDVFFGRSVEMQVIRKKLEMVSRSNVPVLVQGETGTGKELCARLIHGSSDGLPGQLVKVSCPDIPPGLMEAELFGYEEGAFAGAHSARSGRLEEAYSGTLVLDRVGSLSLGLQSKLSQALEDGWFLRMGEEEPRTIHTRIVSIADRDLRQQVAEGTFRLDLLYRINTVTIQLPPLRRRKEDLPQLVEYLMGHHARALQIARVPLSHTVGRLMQCYEWPGNIRQLDTLIRNYVLTGDEDALVAGLAGEAREPSIAGADVDVSQPISLKAVTRNATHDLERQIILKVLKAHNWNRQKTAKWLKISYRSLLYKLNEVEAEDAAGSPGAPSHARVQTAPAWISRSAPDRQTSSSRHHHNSVRVANSAPTARRDGEGSS
jgi:two-component system, NtrC family, response regulator AtoC